MEVYEGEFDVSPGTPLNHFPKLYGTLLPLQACFHPSYTYVLHQLTGPVNSSTLKLRGNKKELMITCCMGSQVKRYEIRQLVQ